MLKNSTRFVLFILLIHSSIASSKALIMTYVYNRPDFIELHTKTFNAFLKDEYEYVVFNDAPNTTMCQIIEQTCKKLDVRCFRVPPHKPHRQAPGYRHIDGITYSLNTLGFDHNDIVIMIDADMFLIKPFSAAQYLKEFDFIGGYQYRSKNGIKVVYTFPGLVFMNMPKLPNKRTISFEGGFINKLACDVGGETHYYFQNNPSLKLKLYTAFSKDGLPKDAQSLRKLGYDENSIHLILDLDRKYGFQFHGDTNFIHYYAGGSNWPGYSKDYLKIKDRFFYDYINKQITAYKTH